MSIKQLYEMNGKTCTCGKTHCFSAQIVTGKGAISKTPALLEELDVKKPYILCDQNTWKAAGRTVGQILAKAGMESVMHCFTWENVEPDEKNVGSAIMHDTSDCDVVIGVGSGVINDIGKIVSAVSGKPYMIVATAPSMDGYASATSSMTRDGIKISLPSKCADIIVGDTEILCKAPLKMMRSGLGDMLAKYVSICEWRIAQLVTGEYYCEEIAGLIRSAVKRCTDHAQGLLSREEDAVQAVFEGLVIGGVAMNYAGLSRPASGVEHYISHVLDMRGVEFGTPVELHGIQCAVGTLYALRLYEKLRKITPQRQKALAYVEQFDYAEWSGRLMDFLGQGARGMISLEREERKYDLTTHRQRLGIILSHWEQILDIIRQELPESKTVEAMLDAIESPKTLTEIGVPEETFSMIFRATKDIRDKYVLSRLAWDLGVLEELI